MAGFSIVTNVSSLLAQESLSKTNDLQQTTIRRLTSGLRINSSADDAAGLAIANRFRSDISVLRQGIRNAADGLSTLQTIDGGLNNISLLIDRARTLATQSASGTFTGDRGTLNAEFQSVLGEIDRQAQAVGLDPGGTFNAALSVFIGGGRSNNNISEVTNGSVQIDLSNSAVNANRLGLQGVQAIGVAGTDISTSSATTSVQDVVGDATNLASLSTAGFTEFFFAGPGFGDDQKARISINLSGVVDTTTLAAAINSSIDGFTAASAAGQAFKAADISAVINTDVNGKQQLAFTSSSLAFQVQAGDLVSNALLGNFSAGPVGASLSVRVQSGTAQGDASVAAANVRVQIDGGGLTSSQTLSLNIANTSTQAEIFGALETAFGANATLGSTGFSITTDTAGDTVSFFNNRGEKFSILVSGDTENLLGFGQAVVDGSNNATFTEITGVGAIDVDEDGNARIAVLIEGSGAASPETIDINFRRATAGATDAERRQDIVDQVNAAIAANATLSSAGFLASLSTTSFKLESTTGTQFQLTVDDHATSLLGLGDNNTHFSTTTFANGDAVTGAGVNAQETLTVAVTVAGVGATSITLTGVTALEGGETGAAATASDAAGTLTFTINDSLTGISSAISVTLAAETLAATAGNIQTAIDTAIGAGRVTVDDDGAGGHFRFQAAATERGVFELDAINVATAGAFVFGVANNTEFGALSAGQVADALNAKVVADNNTTLLNAGVFFSANAAGTEIEVNAFSALTFTGVDGSLVANFESGLTAGSVASSGTISTGTLSEIGTFAESTFNSGGAQATSGASLDDPTAFTGLFYGDDVQNIIVSAKNDLGVVQSLSISLNDTNARNIDEAVNTINAALLQSNNSTLKQIVVVKERLSSSADGLRFLSSATEGFSVSIGDTPNAHGIDDSTAVLSSATLAGGSIADISTKENASVAVALLAEAVNKLATVQADVGKGQNQLQFAIGLASTQITNLAATESRIRDADLAEG
ncbi:MAG: flagellin [Acidobacteria bacterium]|nr:flagellin [Acidobacteriota bacterium]